MYAEHKVVCVTPAGRRRYLKILARYILSSPIVDEYHLWLNTIDSDDVQYLRELRSQSDKVRIIEPPVSPPDENPFTGIPQFFRNCVEEKTIYIRFDDDIVYVEPLFFEKFLQFRIEHQDYFLVFPNIINNAICTYIQAKRNMIDADAVIYPWSMDWTAWWNPRFAEQLHRAFLRSVNNGQINEWYFGPKVLSLSWFSINCMSWFGRDFSCFGGRVQGNEEEYLTIIKPSELSRLNCIFGDAIVAHFAFYPQRDHLDSLDLLDHYARLPDKRPRPSLQSINRSTDRNLWTDRLLEVVSQLRKAPRKDLRDVEFVANQIRQAGLIFDRRLLYGSDNPYMNAGDSGLWQLPMQLARFLLFVSRYRLRTVLECGTGSGWTTVIMAAYLERFNPGLRFITLDVACLFKSYSRVRQSLSVDYRIGETSKEFEGQHFDLVFIDGDHSYEGCRLDYFAVGQNASICAFHDVNDRFVAEFEENNGGVPRVWRELKSQIRSPDQVVEFLDHSEGDRIMGIGAVVHQTAVIRTEFESLRHLGKTS